MTEQELEKLFKDKLGNRDFPVSMENWSRMEQILDANSTAGGTYYWRAVAAVLLFAVSVLGLNYFSPSSQLVAPEEIIAVEELSQEPLNPVVQNDNSTTESNKIEESPTEVIELEPTKKATTPIVASKDESSGNIVQVGASTNVASLVSNNNLPEEGVGTSDQKEEKLSKLILRFKELPSLISKSKDLEVDFLYGDASTDFREEPKMKRGSLLLVGGPLMNATSSSSKMELGFQAGLAYRHQVSDLINLELGLSYLQFNNVGIKDQYDSTFYNFGKEVVETEKESRSLSYLDIPLSVGFNLGSSHELGLSAYTSILLNTSQKTTTTTYATKRAPVENSNKTKGYSEDFNRYDYGLGLFYRYSLNSRFSLGLHVKRGLADITTAESGVYSQEHQNFNARVELRYNIF